MVSVFSKQQVGEFITQTLGERLSSQELQSTLAVAEIVEPPIAKQFWQAAEAQRGIYIILEGKVRLLDNDNLIATITAGSSFGEVTLFPEDDFGYYTARASTNLKLC